jgi:hypothetical protein
VVRALYEAVVKIAHRFEGGRFENRHGGKLRAPSITVSIAEWLGVSVLEDVSTRWPAEWQDRAHRGDGNDFVHSA